MCTQKFYVDNSVYFLNDFVHMSAIHILLVHDSVVEAVVVLSNYQMFANHLFLQIVYKNTKRHSFSNIFVYSKIVRHGFRRAIGNW